VPSRNDKATIARAASARIRTDVGRELAETRRLAGLSQLDAARAVAMSHAQLGRIERAELAGLTVDQVCRAAAAVGLRCSVRLFPDGDPVRDAAQLKLLERFRLRLPDGIRWHTEVPLPIPGDLRAWDGMATLRGRRAGCEAETRLGDIQALERRLALKLRDGAVDVLIVVVADTAANRGALARHREVLRPLLPQDGRQVLAAFRAGHLPDQNGLLLL